jgi:uncharacterized protein YdeI (YjbR/CyaY-like superfamily)
MPTVKEVATGIVHPVPTDLQEVLLADQSLRDKWNALTPIARNEWICWVTIVKKPETRVNHLKRLQEEILEGKKKPCCWPGCPHRSPKAKKWFKNFKEEKQP